MKRALVSLSVFSFLVIGASAATSRIDVPIVLGGNEKFEACMSIGQIVGLDPNGDGFLSVQSGPGGRPFREIARLHNGQMVYICTYNGNWLGIVYTKNRSMECNVSSTWPVRQPYTGPCDFGWVHQRYVRVTAG